MNTTPNLDAARITLAELESKERERHERLTRMSDPYSPQIARARNEIALEAAERHKAALARLKTAATRATLARAALAATVEGGSVMLAQTLDEMRRYLKNLVIARDDFMATAAEVAPGMTLPDKPFYAPEERQKIGEARELMADLRDAEIDLTAALANSTGYLSPLDLARALPSAELGAELWTLALEPLPMIEKTKLRTPFRKTS